MKYLADSVSLFRILCCLPVLYFSYTGEWKLAFIFLIFGWGSDLLDGFLARKFGSLRDSHPNFDADGIADSTLTFTSSVVLMVYVINHIGWKWGSFLIAIFVLMAIVGATMVTIMDKPLTQPRRWLIAINMLLLHSVRIVGTLGWFAYMAFGVAGVVMIAVAMVLVSFLQRRKISLWMAGRFR